MIENPIIRGFNPDPSILRVGNNYYIATSTFEWLPAIRIYHSRDLKHWRLLSHALTGASQIELRGIQPSKGIWAPCLSYSGDEKLFYIAFSFVRGIANNFFDVDNYVVTAESIEGPWSEPVYLNSSGFDPSFFHDEDGRKWLVNLEWDFRMGYEHPGAIVLQEYSPLEKRLVGQIRRIYRGGTDMGCLEGPHIYKRNGRYYLMAAEGGTGYGHGVTVARSKNIAGPYEPDPENPIITSAAVKFNERGDPDCWKPHYYNPDAYLQKSGHGSLVETHTGEFYIAHLCARPILPEMRCMLGRETAIQKVCWTDDGWLRLASGGNLAQRYIRQPRIPEQPFADEPCRDDFDLPELNGDFSTLRIPLDASWASLSERRGYLRMRGQESLFSTFNVSLVAKRIQAFNIQAETCVEFEPENFGQMAGLVCLYDHMNHYFLRIYYSESFKSRCLGLMTSDNGRRDEYKEHRVAVPGLDRIYLRVSIKDKGMRFYYSSDGNAWSAIGPVFDATRLSDEYCKYGEFTGAFVGLCVQDLHTRSKHADFDYFEYREI